MKIIGLFVVVFVGLLISKALGFSETSAIIGAVIGSGVYIILLIGNNTK